ncbi:hypothetical protein [Flagellimonas onchidii]|uniref:hypothetical protein n=1 Tax=Flagellimonas onchidii TaxID=2562684 RepID=UPI0010A6A7D4|nr:hypothetical protein [Allomuricauda onchidii]
MTTVLKTIGAVLSIVLALVLFVAVTPFAFLWKIIASIKRKTFDIGVSHYLIEIAASFDQLGNAVFGGFFNWLCIAKEMQDHYRFGDKDETISEALGWNDHLNTLSDFGKGLVWMLGKLDRDHCKKAMQSGIDKAKQKVSYYETLKVVAQWQDR